LAHTTPTLPTSANGETALRAVTQSDAHDWVVSLIPVAVSLVPLWLQLWDFPARAESNLVRWNIVIGTLILAGAANYWVLRHRASWSRRKFTRIVLSELLEGALRDPQRGLDPNGDLNARLNVMTVHYSAWSRPIIGSLKYVRVFPRGMLFPVACTRRMRSAPDAGLGWPRGLGCVGTLWGTGDQIAVANLLACDPAKEWKLTEEQKTKTGDLTCVVSCVILKDIGTRQEVIGFLNLDSDQDGACSEWVDVDGNVTTDIEERMIAIAEYIADGELLS